MSMMDVDNDIDSTLLQQFSCLGTTDRDVLINQFQKLLGNQLNATDCAFFLDMNNWNLQAAICSYFDFEASKENLPSMSFLKDVTIGEGEAVPPNTKFIKTWRIQNAGDTSWPPGCSLKFTNGDQLSNQESVFVDQLPAHDCCDVSVEMASPSTPGIYQGQWRMCTGMGQLFGEVIWVIVTVAEGGLLAVTQQMEAFHQLGSPRAQIFENEQHNPFASCNGSVPHRQVSSAIAIPSSAIQTISQSATSAPLGSPTLVQTSRDTMVPHPPASSSYPNESCLTWNLSPTQRNTKWKNDC